jgi:hypothetical protein
VLLIETSHLAFCKFDQINFGYFGQLFAFFGFGLQKEIVNVFGVQNLQVERGHFFMIFRVNVFLILFDGVGFFIGVYCGFEQLILFDELVFLETEALEFELVFGFQLLLFLFINDLEFVFLFFEFVPFLFFYH